MRAIPSIHATFVHFIDNHDVPRFLYQYPDKTRFRNALAFLMTTDGIPCLYYGTEQDFAGGPDPSNREDMWDSGFSTSGATFKWIQKLIKIRKELRCFATGAAPVFRFTEDRARHFGFLNEPINIRPRTSNKPY